MRGQLVAERGRLGQPARRRVQADRRLRAASTEGAVGQCWEQNILIWALYEKRESCVLSGSVSALGRSGRIRSCHWTRLCSRRRSFARSFLPWHAQPV
jgi:hypothetical protein